MIVVAATQKGPDKACNEDRVLVGKSILADGVLVSEIDDGLVAVADGVGGNNAGAVASHFVVAKASMLDDISQESLAMLNGELLAFSERGSDYRNMATTFAGVLFRGREKDELFSIGNTRIYAMTGGTYLRQLTTDDTTVNYLVRSGQMSKEEAETNDRKSEITACFGGGSPKLFALRQTSLETSGPLLITSDGIHDFLDIDELEGIMQESGVTTDACQRLIYAARDSGSMDDASVVLLDPGNCQSTQNDWTNSTNECVWRSETSLESEDLDEYLAMGMLSSLSNNE